MSAVWKEIRKAIVMESQKLRSKILCLINQYGPLWTSGISVRLGVSVSRIKEELQSLKLDGVLKCTDGDPNSERSLWDFSLGV